jgi:prepilin peptidase CpaA
MMIAIALAYSTLAATALILDFATLRIPNLLTAALLGLFVAATLCAPAPVAWLSHFAAGLVALGFGTVCFAARWMGAGDVKLFTVLALWTGLDALPEFGLVVGLLGAGVTLGVLLLRRPALELRLATLGILPASLKAGAGVPYGIAIALGGLIVTSPLLPGWASPVAIALR